MHYCHLVLKTFHGIYHLDNVNKRIDIESMVNKDLDKA